MYFEMDMILEYEFWWRYWNGDLRLVAMDARAHADRVAEVADSFESRLNLRDLQPGENERRNWYKTEKCRTERDAILAELELAKHEASPEEVEMMEAEKARMNENIAARAAEADARVHAENEAALAAAEDITWPTLSKGYGSAVGAAKEPSGTPSADEEGKPAWISDEDYTAHLEAVARFDEGIRRDQGIATREAARMAHIEEEFRIHEESCLKREKEEETKRH